MPPKRNLNKRSTKSKIPQLTKASTSQSSTLPAENIQPEDDSNSSSTYEDELNWCIEQLQLGATSNKLSTQQVAESQKIMKTLMNPTAALVRKRQLMRNYFGDYRKKMELERKKFTLDINKMKISPAAALVTEKSKCLRKHTTKNESNDPLQQSNLNEQFHYSASDNSFRFNFQNLAE